MAFQDSRTYQNLIAAYNKELMLSARYLIYSDIARNAGYMEISGIYDEIAKNNKEHARIWLRQINEGKLPSISEALRHSMQIEYDMASVMYQNFTTVAREEGYNDTAALFSGVANIDYNHSIQFQEILGNVETNQVFCKPQEKLWFCMQCGNIMSGQCAPEICPVCGFPQGFYKMYIVSTQ